MAMNACLNGQMMCSFGLAPSNLMVLPVRFILTSNKFAANIMDHTPMVNIMPFGMCTSIANPVVASATSAALGVLTPMPCIPNTTTPWAPGSPMVKVDNQPALNNTSTLACAWGGVITFITPGQFTHLIP